MKDKTNFFIAFLLSCFFIASVNMPVMAITPRYNVHPYSFELTETNKTVQAGEEFTLKATGSGVTLGKTTWSTSDDSVVSITETEVTEYGFNDGYIVRLKALKSGTVTITARNTMNSDKLTCKVTVNEGEEKEEIQEYSNKTLMDFWNSFFVRRNR